MKTSALFNYSFLILFLCDLRIAFQKFQTELVCDSNFPANIYSLKANNRNTRKRCEICFKLTIKTPERRV